MALLWTPVFGGYFSKGDRGLQGPAVLKMETGVRALSLGGAFVGSADDASALFWNPAGLERVPRQEFIVGHSRVFEDQTREDLGWVLPAWRRGERETWGVQASYLAMDSFDLVKNGVPAGSAQPWEGALGLSYARPFRNLFWGITGKVARKEFPGASGQSYLLDGGLQGESKNLGMAWGFVIADLGTTMSLGEGTLAPPTVFRLGGTKRFLLGRKNQLRWSGQIDAPSDDTAIARMGLEYVVPGKEWEAALRLGGQTAGASKLTAGFGVGRGSLGFNYAYGPSESLGAAHRMDVTFRFGRPLEPEVRRRDLFESAQAAWSSGQTARAADLLEEIEGISPRYFPAQALGKEVNRRIEESLKPDTLFTLGLQAYEAKDFETAENYLRKLVILDPSYPEAGALLKKAETGLAAARDSQARAELTRGLERERKSLRRSAQEDQRFERWPEALKNWRSLLVRFPKDAEALAGVTLCRNKIASLAASAERAGEGGKALSFYRLLQEDRPDPALAKRIEKMGGEARAETQARARALYQEGVRAYDGGNLKKALPLFEEAARLNPDDAAIARARDRVRTELKRAK
ncbi:MAG: PorV/PorQ family protein [Elusimicrobia bacterium]|nr:PorV/PorQ family protein [Elusimicrobiota bacterium]